MDGKKNRRLGEQGCGEKGGRARGTRGLLEQADHRRVLAAWPLRSRHTCHGGGQSLGTEGGPALSPRPHCHKGEAARPAVHRERWASGPGIQLHCVGCPRHPAVVSQGRSQVGTDPEIGPRRGHLPWSKQGGADFPRSLLGGKVKPHQAAELFEMPTPSSQHSRLQPDTPAMSFTRGLGALGQRPQGAQLGGPSEGSNLPGRSHAPHLPGPVWPTTLSSRPLAGLASAQVGVETIASIPR